MPPPFPCLWTEAIIFCPTFFSRLVATSYNQLHRDTFFLLLDLFSTAVSHIRTKHAWYTLYFRNRELNWRVSSCSEYEAMLMTLVLRRPVVFPENRFEVMEQWRSLEPLCFSHSSGRSVQIYWLVRFIPSHLMPASPMAWLAKTAGNNGSQIAI